MKSVIDKTNPDILLFYFHIFAAGLAFNHDNQTIENMENENAIDQYISVLPPEVQIIMEQVRKTIHEAAPEAVEAVKWGMPTFVLNGNLVHFAACKKHIGFYPGASGIETFKSEFADYKSSKGAVQFPLDKPMPLKLITKIVKFRIKENLESIKK